MKRTIKYRNKSVVAVRPIEASDFNSLGEFAVLEEKQDLPVIVVTDEAWFKMEKLVDSQPAHSPSQ